jgi:predicted acylesterase/phospholipase RssA
MPALSFIPLARVVAVVICGVQLAGCLAGERTDGVPAQYAGMAQVVGYPNVRIWGDDATGIPPQVGMLLRAQRLAAAKTDPTVRLDEINALTLSGGGSSGAFGAGILAGWTEAGTRPKFDIVTGISTGSLIAPFAFLGPAYDKRLGEAFTSISDEDIFERNSIFQALHSGSFTSNEPLRKMLEKYLTHDMIDEIARETAKGRRLLVGTTNLDADRPVIWNMGAIAASDRPDRDQLFRDVIIASTAIPGFFPPMHFDVTANGKTYEEMHVDGGTTTEVFLMPPGMTARALAGKDGPLAKKRRLFVIRNGRTVPEYSVVKANLASIAGKAISSLIDTQAVGDLYRLYAIARRDHIDYNVVSIPQSFTVESKSAFDNDYMRALYQLGYEMGRKGVRWEKYPPGFVN